MSSKYGYDIIPIIALEILTLFWCITWICFAVIKNKYKNQKLGLSVRQFCDKHANTLEEEYKVEFKKMILKKYSYDYKKYLLNFSEDIENSHNILDLIIAIKSFNNIRLENSIYNGERVVFNISTILNIVKYVFILVPIFNLVSVILFILLANVFYNSSENTITGLTDSIKIFAVLSLSLFLFLWVIWTYNYEKYIKEIDIDSYEFFSEQEMKDIKKILKLSYLLLGFK